MKRCINCKQEIINFGAKRLEGFSIDIPPKTFRTGTDFVLWDQEQGEVKGAAYPFWADGEDGCFWHFTLFRGFQKGQILLRIGEVFTSYLKHPWDVAFCTYRTLSNGSYSRLMTIPAKAQVASPWFAVENDKESLLQGLERLGDWFDQHREEIAESCRKQQGWVDKEQGRSHRVARLYLQEHWREADQAAVLALYREVDRLAEAYEAAKKRGEIHFGQELFQRLVRREAPCSFQPVGGGADRLTYEQESPCYKGSPLCPKFCGGQPSLFHPRPGKGCLPGYPFGKEVEELIKRGKALRRAGAKSPGAVFFF